MAQRESCPRFVEPLDVRERTSGFDYFDFLFDRSSEHILVQPDTTRFDAGAAIESVKRED